MLRLVRFVNVASTGLLAGLLLDFWLFVAPSLPAAEIEALNRRYLVAAPVLYAVVNVSALLLVILLRRRSGIAFGFAAAGILCGAVATAVTLLVDVPIGAGSQAVAPAAEWVVANAVRTTLMLAAFACQVLAALSSPRRPE